MIKVTHAQIMTARAILRRAEANGDTVDPRIKIIANSAGTVSELDGSISRHPSNYNKRKNEGK
jgi:hypothetical protein